jgi:cytidylate kinase
MSSNLMIAVSGKSGCGNTSVSRLVAEALGLRLINYTFHNYAEDLGISFEEMMARASRDTSWDLKLDEKQLHLARQGGCVLGSRLAIWLLKEATLKVYLTASPRVRAERISGRESKDIERVMAETASRDANDRQRFLSLYKIDNDDYSFADLIINTEEGDQYAIALKIVDKVRSLDLA